MMLRRFLPKSLPGQLSKRSNRSGRLVVAYRDREWLYYLVANFKPGYIQPIISDCISHTDSAGPLTALADRLRSQKVSASQLVVLLSRTDLEVLSLELPQAAPHELPMMVESAVEQQTGETDSLPIIDYFRVDKQGLRSSQDLETVLAYSLSPSRLESISTEAEKAGFRLAGVSVRQLPALSLLKSQPTGSDSSLVVSIQVYLGEVELALCYQGKPMLMRSVRVNLDDCQRAAEQLALEVERCMSLLPPEIEELKRLWLVDRSHDSAQALADALRASTSAEVQTVQAVVRSGQLHLQEYQDKSGSSSDHSFATDPHRSPADAAHPVLLPAALIGTAWEIANQSLDIDFVHPKKAPAPPNPWVRPVMWGAAGAAALAVLSITLLSDVWNLQAEVNGLESEVAEARKLQAKLQEKADQVQLVENWLREQVDWLTALNEISERLPDGQSTSVRRLSASVNEGIASFDLSVQVLQPEDIAVLENRLRSVKYSVSSKRISQSPEASEYPWKFETRVTFPAEPLDWNQYVASDTLDVGGGKSESTSEPASPQPSNASHSEAKTGVQEDSEIARRREITEGSRTPKRAEIDREAGL